MPRYRLTISYDGSGYSGFQIQKGNNTIQSILEKCLNTSIGERVSIVASGRTDAGVSAIEQVCHMDTTFSLDTKRIIGYTNSLLPRTIRILDISQVDNDFHARYNSKKKTYDYLFYVSREIIPIYDKFATHIGYNIDISSMTTACRFFLGEHDFTAFCASNTEVKSKVRTIYDMNIKDLGGGLYRMSVTGNGFLYNMVRIIMGTLVSVGEGKISPEDISIVINSLDRSKAGKTMPSKGLYLKKVLY